MGIVPRDTELPPVNPIGAPPRRAPPQPYLDLEREATAMLARE
jgi:hypothetical protein